jgi:hypothetical protein
VCSTHQWIPRRERAGNARFRGESGHQKSQPPRPLVTDTVEKGKNELIEIFAYAPVETDFP